MQQSNMLTVRCKNCQRVLLPVRDKIVKVRGNYYMRWQYQCENVMCEAIGETQHRSAPQKVEMQEVQS